MIRIVKYKIVYTPQWHLPYFWRYDKKMGRQVVLTFELGKIGINIIFGKYKYATDSK